MKKEEKRETSPSIALMRMRKKHLAEIYTNKENVFPSLLFCDLVEEFSSRVVSAG